MSAKQNWIQLPGAIFDKVEVLESCNFERLMESGHKANINLGDIFAFDGCEGRTMVFINRLNPHYGLLNIGVNEFTKIFFEDVEDKAD